METTVKQSWNVDNMHSEVHFKVKHLVISTVTGSFKQFEGSIVSDSDDFDGAVASFNIDTSSVDTNVADRDAHLKSPDFFDVEKYPKISFTKGILTKTGEDTYQMSGDLTIRDITKSITLDVVFGGQMKDGYGQTKAGFEITGNINRKDFGLNWSMVTEAGGVVVGENVKLVLNIQVTKS